MADCFSYRVCVLEDGIVHLFVVLSFYYVTIDRSVVCSCCLSLPCSLDL